MHKYYITTYNIIIFLTHYNTKTIKLTTSELLSQPIGLYTRIIK